MAKQRPTVKTTRTNDSKPPTRPSGKPTGNPGPKGRG